MPDLADQAQESETLFLSAALAGIDSAAPALPANGRCYNCLVRVKPRHRFCYADCRDDYAHRKAAEARRGLVRR